MFDQFILHEPLVLTWFGKLAMPMPLVVATGAILNWRWGGWESVLEKNLEAVWVVGWQEVRPHRQTRHSKQPHFDYGLDSIFILCFVLRCLLRRGQQLPDAYTHLALQTKSWRYLTRMRLPRNLISLRPRSLNLTHAGEFKKLNGMREWISACRLRKSKREFFLL